MQFCAVADTVFIYSPKSYEMLVYYSVYQLHLYNSTAICLFKMHIHISCHSISPNKNVLVRGYFNVL